MTTLTEARRALKHWEREVERLQDELCAKQGHVKGTGAFEGYSYCKICRGQIDNTEFGRKLIPLPVVDPSMLEGK